MEKKVIKGVWAEYHPEKSMVYLMYEDLDGKEHCLHDCFVGDEIPTFADENISIEDSDYEEWYASALELANKRGLVLQ